MSEAELQNSVLELASLLGWKVAHFRPAMTAKGWRTPVEGDGAGFPDLVLLRGGRMVVAELKSQNGKVAEKQDAWLAEFHLVEGTDVYVWRPEHWLSGAIERCLR